MYKLGYIYKVVSLINMMRKKIEFLKTLRKPHDFLAN
jgi:hypothetical protein